MIRKFLFLLMCCCSFCLFGQHQNLDDSSSSRRIFEEYFIRVDIMPSWKYGCDEGDEACTEKKLMEFSE